MDARCCPDNLGEGCLKRGRNSFRYKTVGDPLKDRCVCSIDQQKCQVTESYDSDSAKQIISKTVCAFSVKLRFILSP